MQITTDRLLLREYDGSDLAALLAYQADPQVREFYAPEEGDPEHVAGLLRTFQSWAADRPRTNYQLAIALRTAPRTLIGSVGLRQAGQALGQADFGLELAPAWWGQGYATEAARALLTVGFGTLGVTTVRGVTVSANTRVTRLVRRLGFELVGTDRGPAWMTERGWSYNEWRLTRAQQEAGPAM